MSYNIGFKTQPHKARGRRLAVSKANPNNPLPIQGYGLLGFTKGVHPNLLKTAAAAGLLALSIGIATAAPTTDAQVSSSPSATLQATGIASNGMKYVDMANMTEEQFKLLPFSVRMEVKKWQKQEIDKTVASLLEEGKQQNETVASLLEEGKQQNEFIAQKGNEYSLTLQSIDIQQVAHFFKTSVPDGKGFLEYVVKNNLPPPGFAQKVLDVMNQASRLGKK